MKVTYMKTGSAGYGALEWWKVQLTPLSPFFFLVTKIDLFNFHEGISKSPLCISGPGWSSSLCTWRRLLPTASLISPRLSAIRRPISPIIHSRSYASRPRLSTIAQSPSNSRITNLVLRHAIYNLIYMLLDLSTLTSISCIALVSHIARLQLFNHYSSDDVRPQQM